MISNRALVRTFWGLTLVAVVVWSQVPGYVVGWDSAVYVRAMHALLHGGDPYADGMTRQWVYHQEAVHAPGEPIPYTYVYSPLTLPLLRSLARLPIAAVETVFWVLYFAGALVAIWAGTKAATGREERQVIALIAPAAIFFPGLLQNDVLFSGNIAFILYGLVLGCVVLGWQRGRWMPFYFVVLGASCWKVPLLSLLALPVLSTRKQWGAAVCTAVAGVLAFVVQPYVWPVLFQHYIQAVDLQFQWNHDFGFHPAGVVANVLFRVVSYRVTSGLVYGAVATGVLVTLFRLRSRYLSGEISLSQWSPVLLTGVVLLNPRIMEYDVAAITVPLALVSWRFLRRRTRRGRSAAWWGLGGLLLINAFAPFAWNDFAPFVGPVVESLVIVAVFSAGCWDLLHPCAQTAGEVKRCAA